MSMTYPNGEIFDQKRARRFNIIYPDRRIHNIIAQYVQITDDGKYVLKLLECYKEEFFESYLEIVSIGGEWSVLPFKKDNYSEYHFLPFDRGLSDLIIDQFPPEMRFRMIVSDTQKVDELFAPRKEEKPLIESANPVSYEDVTSLYMLLPVNDEDCTIDKSSDYSFDFAFPVFSLLGIVEHQNNPYESMTDFNYDYDFNEEMYLCERVPISVRRKVQDFLENYAGEKIDLKNLSMEVDIDDEKVNMRFIACPDFDLFNQIMKADKMFVDHDMPVSEKNKFDSRLAYATSKEIPLEGVYPSGEKFHNRVKHRSYPNVRIK